MSTETIEKKLYPSQLNTKTISARIPVQDYVEFLQDSIKKGISLNDWLLLRIYNNQNKVGNNIDAFVQITKQELFDNGDYMEQVYEYWKDEFINDTLTFSKEEFIDLLSKIEMDYRNIQHYISLQQNRKASLSDVKTQLTILINNKFNDPKDRKEYRADLFELLNELS